MDEQKREPAGTPVGRRTILGVVGLGVAAVVGGSWAQNGLSRLLGPLEYRDPTGLIALFPLGDTFRFYSVTGCVPARSPATYRLDVTGLVAHPSTYSVADLQAMPQTALVRDFHCVTGWRVPQVHWSGVPLSSRPRPGRLRQHGDGDPAHSFDGTYTEA